MATSSKRRAVSWLGVAFSAALLVVVFSAPTYAVHDTGVFQLDGDASSATQPPPPYPQATDDWDKVCHQYSGHANPDTFCSTTQNTSGSTAGLWTCDTSLNASASCTLNATLFTGGGSKDPQLISSWAWKDGAGGLPGKDNLLHAFAVRYSLPPAPTCPSGTAPSCEVIYFGSDRFDNSGDAQQGFWFLKNKIGLGTNTVGGGQGFTGSHATGDVLVVSDFSVGGATSTITVYTWDPVCTATNKPFGYCADANLHQQATSTNAKCSATLVADSFCGIVNPSDNTFVPWNSDFTDKKGNNTYAAGEFYEAGINLSALGLGGECFSSVVSESRSSTSTTATLQDFIVGTFGQCTPHMTTQASTNSSVLPGTPVSDTATVTISGASAPANPIGTVTFFLCGPIAAGADCSTGGTNVGTGTLANGTPNQGSATATSPTVNDATKTGTNGPLAVGHYCFRAEWPGDSNYPGGATHTDSTFECFDVIKLNTQTVTTPVDGSGTPESTITIGQSIFDKAVVTGSNVDPTGSVTFFVCGANTMQTLCTSAGTNLGTVTIQPDATPNDGVSSATSGVFTPTAIGSYCFRADYSGDSIYNNSSDSSGTECFTVTTSTSASSAQNWLPNDHVTISSAGTSVAGTLSITLHSGTCAGPTVYTEPVPNGGAFTATTTGASYDTTNTSSFKVDATNAGVYFWNIVFTPNSSFAGGAITKCETSTVTINDNP